MGKAASSECFSPFLIPVSSQARGNYAGFEFLGEDLKPGGPAFVPPTLAQRAINDR